MKSLKQLSVLKRLNYLIKIEATGTADKCAKKLGISRATFFRYRNTLLEIEAPIEYCYDRQSYVYSGDFELNLDSLIF